MYDLTVIIPTYNRAEILFHTIQHLQSNLIYDLGEVHYLIGVDGDDDTPTKLRGFPNLKMLQGPRRGLGANLNALIQACPTELILQIDDDHHLVEWLDINEHCQSLIGDNDFGWIRIYFGECIKAEGYYHFTGKLNGRYWRLLPNAGELYIPSNRPHLKIKTFHAEQYGYYTPGLKLGQTENDFCHHFAEMYREGETLAVYMPMYPPPESTWSHVGDSYQGTIHDK